MAGLRARHRGSAPAPVFRAWLVVAVVAVGVLVLGGLIVLAGHRPQPEPTARRVAAPNAGAEVPGRTAATVAATPARRTGAVAAERPVSSRLPDGVVVPLRPAGTRRDGRLDVPADIRTAAWWRGGALLGDPFGSTLLAGHVDSSTRGLGPFASLLSVRPGQRVVLASAHLRQVFQVVSLRLVRRTTVSRHRGIFSPRGARRLTLVTCAGPYDVRRGGYQRLALVTALPVTEARRTRS
jgi:hypothetical protein